ncbi:putative 9-cis-epoxycarotenoid dioxygenase [Fusarium oxysporum f. sp. albedinis]|nr:putative 9-cis-epoxycarotenoid dioxygenase [Fusarium oxysporum f. sp. albedinis]
MPDAGQSINGPRSLNLFVTISAQLSKHTFPLFDQRDNLYSHQVDVIYQGEIGNVVVRGTIPNSVDGTFYRVGPLSGHGVVSAFRIHKGQVDFKIRYIKNDRYKVERNRKQSLWKDTTGMDPYGNQTSSPTFTAHPKIDPHTDHLVTWGIDYAKSEIISFSVDRQGIVRNEHRVQRSIPGLVHDIAITENWIIFCLWPTSFNPSPKPGETHAVWDTDRPALFYMVHTAGGWEEGGKIYFEGTWPRTVLFPFWSTVNGQKNPPKKTYVDLVRLEIDTMQLTNTEIPDPVTLKGPPNNKYIFKGLNATTMLIKSTGKLEEPVFIPWSNTSLEGDSYNPIAVIELLLRMRAQVYGNWVDARELNDRALVEPPPLHHMSYKHGPAPPATTEEQRVPLARRNELGAKA